MIVGQYVLGIKVPGRSNSVIFMISGRSSWGGEGERNAAESQRGKGGGQRLVNPRRQESSPSFASKHGPLASTLYARMRRRIVISGITSVKYVLELMRICILHVSDRTVALYRKE